MTTRQPGSNFTDLCKFAFADGRMCAMPGLPAFNGYCRSHASLGRPKPPTEENLIAEILEFVNPETGHIDVHGALQQVFRAMAANKISTRRAATFGYLGQLILLSDPTKPSKQEHMREVHDLYNMTSSAPRAKRSSPACGATIHSPKPAATPADACCQNKSSFRRKPAQKMEVVGD
ncbi:MAG: hypothetical protein WBR26_19910 [Candidatus Acidiferrum sp.]